MIFEGFIREQIVKRITRSSGWRKVRNKHLLENPKCAACGKKRKSGMQVHHIVPFSVDPSLELVPSNLITLCDKHHLLFGHLQYWKSYNNNVINDCEDILWKIKKRP